MDHKKTEKLDSALINTLNQFLYSHDTIYSDDVTIILKGHLVTEHLLNEIIKNKLRNSKKITEFKFGQKIEILYSFELIPPHLYSNLLILNAIRNRYSHKLKYNLTEERYNIMGVNGRLIESNKINLKNSKDKAHIICIAVLIQLSEFMADKLNVDPDFN